MSKYHKQKQSSGEKKKTKTPGQKVLTKRKCPGSVTGGEYLPPEAH